MFKRTRPPMSEARRAVLKQEWGKLEWYGYRDGKVVEGTPEKINAQEPTP